MRFFIFPKNRKDFPKLYSDINSVKLNAKKSNWYGKKPKIGLKSQELIVMGEFLAEFRKEEIFGTDSKNFNLGANFFCRDGIRTRMVVVIERTSE